MDYGGGGGGKGQIICGEGLATWPPSSYACVSQSRIPCLIWKVRLIPERAKHCFIVEKIRDVEVLIGPSSVTDTCLNQPHFYFQHRVKKVRNVLEIQKMWFVAAITTNIRNAK